MLLKGVRGPTRLDRVLPLELRLRAIAEKIPASNIDELWVFPPLPNRDLACEFIVLVCYDGGEGHRRILTSHVDAQFKDPESDEFAHASGIIVLTPEGRLARYFYGVEYSTRDLRFALMEASENRIGTVVDQMILYCYSYDPETGTYAAATFFIMRTGAILTVLFLVTIILLFRWREHHRARGQEA